MGSIYANNNFSISGDTEPISLVAKSKKGTTTTMAVTPSYPLLGKRNVKT